MKYYLGEIYITHKKFLWLWWPFYMKKPSSVLIQANSHQEAMQKAREWGIYEMGRFGVKCKYKAFAIPAI